MGWQLNGDAAIRFGDGGGFYAGGGIAVAASAMTSDTETGYNLFFGLSTAPHLGQTDQRFHRVPLDLRERHQPVPPRARFLYTGCDKEMLMTCTDQQRHRRVGGRASHRPRASSTASPASFQGSYSFTTRFEGAKGTNPEELIAAAHASCLSMALSAGLEKAGTPPTRITTTASATIDKVGDGFKITRMRLEVRGEVPGHRPGGVRQGGGGGEGGLPGLAGAQGQRAVRAGREAGIDPVCHTLVGAGLARSGLARRTALGTTTLLIGANLPDVDVLAYFWGPAADLAFRRGWTHGILALALWPFVLTGAMLLLRPRASAGCAERRCRPAWCPGSCSSSPAIAILVPPDPRHAQHLRRALADAVQRTLVLRRHALHRGSRGSGSRWASACC